jgi:hypothetical protein
MPNLKLTNLATYKAYFADIATKHKEIDGYKWGDKDVIRNDNRSDMPARVLWAVPYDKARYGDRMSDNVNKTKVARVAYLVVPDSEKFSDEDAAFDLCEAVIEQIIAKIYVDKRGAMNAGVWEMIATDISSWSSSPVEMIIASTKYIGWELQMNFMDNTNLEYDPAKWD